MGLSEALQVLAERAEPSRLDEFAAHLDPEWIEQALQATGVATLRRRLLPAEQVIWLVIGMAMFRNRPIWEVVDKLDLAMSDRRRPVLDRSATIKARQRLGEQPMRWLFERCGKHWGHTSASADRWRGLSLYGLDGTTFRVPDSESNRSHFGLASGGPQGNSAYPVVRMVALMALRSHLLVDATFGPYSQGEYHYAGPLWSSLPNQSLCIVDRAFWSAQILMGLHHTEAKMSARTD